MKLIDLIRQNWLPLLFASVGVVDVILRTVVLGSWARALEYSLHDPGKILFHIFILPCGVWLYIRSFRLSVIRDMRQRLGGPQRLVFFVICGALFGLGLPFTYQYENDGRCGTEFREKNFIMPYDVRDRTQVVEMIKLRDQIYRAIDVDSSSTDPVQKKKADSLLAMQTAYQNLSHRNEDSAQCSILSVGSISSVWGLGGTILSSAFIGLVISTLALIILSGIDKSLIEKIVGVALIVAPWLLLRLYSESFIGFSRISVASATGIIIFFGVLVVFLCTAFVFRDDKAKSLKRLSTVYTALSALYSVVVAMNPSFLRVPFLFIYGISPFGTLLVFFVVLLPLLLALWKPSPAPGAELG